jgi:hypothetical protein
MQVMKIQVMENGSNENYKQWKMQVWKMKVMENANDKNISYGKYKY